MLPMSSPMLRMSDATAFCRTLMMSSQKKRPIGARPPSELRDSHCASKIESESTRWRNEQFCACETKCVARDTIPGCCCCTASMLASSAPSASAASSSVSGASAGRRQPGGYDQSAPHSRSTQ